MKHTSEIITNRQACVLAILYQMTNCFSALYGVSAGRDVWIAYIIAAVFSVLLWIVITAVSEKYPNYDFFTLLTHTLGRPLAWIIILLTTLYGFLSAATSVAEFGKFTQLTALSKTPQIIIPLLLLLLCCYALKHGVGVLARCASLLLPFICFVFICFLIFGIEFIKSENITPVMSSGYFPIIRSALSIFINQFGRTILLTALLHNIKRNKKGKKHGILLGVSIGSAAICLLSFITVSTLGPAETASEFYPVFTVLSIRNIGGFIQHMEILTSIASAFFVLFRAALGLYFVSGAVSYLFKQPDLRIHLIPLSLLIISLTQFLYRNTMNLRKSSEGDIAVIITFPLQFIIPVIICGIAWIKKRRMSANLRK